MENKKTYLALKKRLEHIRFSMYNSSLYKTRRSINDVRRELSNIPYLSKVTKEEKEKIEYTERLMVSLFDNFYYFSAFDIEDKISKIIENIYLLSKIK